MTTFVNQQIQSSTTSDKHRWKHMVEFAQNLAMLNKQRANLTRLRGQFRLEQKCIRDIGPTQFDLIWAYSSHYLADGAGKIENK